MEILSDLYSAKIPQKFGIVNKYYMIDSCMPLLNTQETSWYLPSKYKV